MAGRSIGGGLTMPPSPIPARWERRCRIALQPRRVIGCQSRSFELAASASGDVKITVSLVRTSTGAASTGGRTAASVYAEPHGGIVDEDLRRRVSQMNPNPDYDASDELEYGIACVRVAAAGPLPSAFLRAGLGQRRRS